MFLKVENLTAYYGLKKVLFDISFFVKEQEIVAIIGPNGAGKTTTLRSIFGIHPKSVGTIIFDGQEITKESCVKKLVAGICYVPQGGKVFYNLTVKENLAVGSYIIKDKNIKQQRMDEVYSLFPILAERGRQLANTLSGGQRQMLAIGMSMMLRPRVLLLDEPSIGLSPSLVPKLMAAIQDINLKYNTSVMIVEQNARQVLKIAQRVYVMKVGKITDMDKPEKFSSREELKKVYLSDLQ